MSIKTSGKLPTFTQAKPKGKKIEPHVLGRSIRTLEQTTIDRFRYFFIYDFEKYEELPFPEYLEVCTAFYKVENSKELEQSDREAIAYYLFYSVGKLEKFIDTLGIKLNKIGYQTALENIERIRFETSITPRHLDIELIECAPNEWLILLIINQIF